jgi:hypothetical protein
LRRQFLAARLDQFLQTGRGGGMLGIDRHHLPQEFFALGFIVRHRAQP